ncbi:hypothetical protein QEN19_002031 [Hanseniaspora menglaensis]
MFLSNNGNKRRSLFFGNNNDRAPSTSGRRDLANASEEANKSNFKTFSVVHVSNPDEYNEKVKKNSNFIDKQRQSVLIDQPKRAVLLRKSSSNYKSETSTVKPALSVLSRRRPPPTLDINSIYESINNNVVISEPPTDENDASSSVYMASPNEKDAIYNMFSQQNLFEPNVTLDPLTKNDSFDQNDASVDHIGITFDKMNASFDKLDKLFDEDDYSDVNSFTNSEDYVTQLNKENEQESIQSENSIDESDLSAVKKSLSSSQTDKFEDIKESSITDDKNDYMVSSNYNMHPQTEKQQLLLSEFTKRHNREKSQVEEYLDELEGFDLSDDYTNNNEYSNVDKLSVDDSTFNYTENTLLFLNDDDENDSSSESNVFVNVSNGLKVVNAESDDQRSFVSVESEESFSTVDDANFRSSSSSFVEAHSQLSAIKSLYHSEGDDIMPDQTSLPSLPYTIDNNNENLVFTNVTNIKSTPSSAHIAESILGSPSPIKSLQNNSNVISSGIEQPFAPKSSYVSKLLHKHPTSNKSSFKFDIPLNLQFNPAEDINAKTRVVKQGRKSKNIKHKTTKKKLLSEEEPPPIELIKTYPGGLGSLTKGNAAYKNFLGDIDEEERFILQNLPGAEGYEANSLAKNSYDNELKHSNRTRNRSDTAKSYYTRNFSRLRTETISTTDSIAKESQEELQVTNPDDSLKK